MTALPSCPPRRQAGFTLAEILLALLVFAIAITTILALLARSIESVDEILLKDEAMRLSGAVEDYMQKRSFNDAYSLIYGNNVNPDTVNLAAFHHRVDPGNLDSPHPSRQGIPGTDYLVLPLVKPSDDVSPDENNAREGRVFKVRLTLSAETNPATSQEVNATTFPADPNSYLSAVVVVLAEYFAVGNPNSPLAGLTPVLTYNFAVRR